MASLLDKSSLKAHIAQVNESLQQLQKDLRQESKKRVFCGKHLQEIIMISRKQDGTMQDQYCKQCFEEGNIKMSLESVVTQTKEEISHLMSQLNQTESAYINLHSKYTRNFNQSARSMIQQTKVKINKWIDDYFSPNQIENIRTTMFRQQFQELELFKEGFPSYSAVLRSIHKEVEDYYKCSNLPTSNAAKILKSRDRIKEIEAIVTKYATQLSQTEQSLSQSTSLQKIMDDYQVHIFDEIATKLGHTSNLKVIPNENIDHHLSVNDEDRLYAQSLINKLKLNQQGIAYNQSSHMGGSSQILIFDSFRNDDDDDVQRISPFPNHEEEPFDEFVRLETEDDAHQEIFASYLDEQLDKLNNLDNQVPTQHQDYSIYNNEIQRLKDLVQREEESVKQRVSRLENQKITEKEIYQTISGIKYELLSLLRKDLFFVKPESKEIYIYDFETNVFSGHKIDDYIEMFPKNFACCQRLNREIFLFGGVDQKGNYSKLTLQIKISHNQFKEFVKEKAEMISLKCHIPLTLIKNKYVYLCGGFHKQMLQSCEIYSIEEDRWFEGPELNYPRANCSACPFDDRYIYIFTGKHTDSTLFIEKLDTGLDGSSCAMRSLDEDLTLPLDYKWEVLKLTGEKEFIENMHYNGTLQISSTDILIFGGSLKQSYLFEIDPHKQKQKLVKLGDKYKQKLQTRFSYEKDFQAVVRKDKLYAIDISFKMIHILNLKGISSDKIDNKKHNQSRRSSNANANFEEDKSLAQTLKLQINTSTFSSNTRNGFRFGQNDVKSAFTTTPRHDKKTSINISDRQAIKSEWNVISFKDAGISGSSMQQQQVFPEKKQLFR